MSVETIDLLYGNAAEFARERVTKETDPDTQEALRRYAIEANEVARAADEMNTDWCRAAARNVNYQYITRFKVRTPCTDRG